MNPRRFAGATDAPNARTGTIASSSGSASAAPMPRKKVRRGNAILVIVMTGSLLLNKTRNAGCPYGPSSLTSGRRGGRWRRYSRPHLKGRAPDNARDQRPKTVMVRGRVARDLADGGRVVVFDAAPERIDEQLFG